MKDGVDENFLDDFVDKTETNDGVGKEFHN